jgi:two-component system sensor histidine kinase AlgZ
MKQDAPKHFFLPDLCSRQAVGVLILVAELLAIVLVLARSGFSASGWADLGMTSLFVQLVTLSTAGLLCQVRTPLARLPRNVAAALAFAVVVFTALAFSIAKQWAYGAILDPGLPDPGVSLANVAANVLVAAIIGGLILRYFYVQEQLRLQQEAELEARIQALQSRIRPHFLFNSMNIIASLIATDPDTAESVVEDLADLFRASLREAGSEIPLRQEIDLCRRYMRIEQLRIGGRLKVEWHTETAPIDDIRIPLLTLQPLLENAVYHGIQPLAGGGTVSVRVDYRDGVVQIRVENPVAPEATGAPASGHRGNRMALDNIRHRLQAVYGPQARLITGREDGTYGTTLQYPFKINGHGQLRRPA